MFVSISLFLSPGEKKFRGSVRDWVLVFFFFFLGFYWLRNGGEDCVDFGLVGLKFGKVGFEF